MGPTGATIIIVKKSLLGRADNDVPIMCDWTTFEKSAGTYYNTPPCWTIYVTGLNVSYMNQKGGLALYDREAQIKSDMLYHLLDNSKGYYMNRTQKEFRSRINVNFRIEGDRTLEKKLMAEADKIKIVNIAGHPTNPGIRISMYNAMPIDGVVHLCHFLERFMKENPIRGSARM
jgi:phosphoserine aminotransferase